jgi:hypothetical protein
MFGYNASTDKCWVRHELPRNQYVLAKISKDAFEALIVNCMQSSEYGIYTYDGDVYLLTLNNLDLN